MNKDKHGSFIFRASFIDKALSQQMVDFDEK